MNYLLEGIRVIDAASFLAGPGAATVLADFGADVIKIEPPAGDGYRTLVGPYPVPYHWLLTSRNKRSLALDLTQEAGRAVLHDLVKDADVLLCNFVGSQLDRFDISYETLKAINPRLIYGHMTGYGTEGPDAERRAFDVTAWWARSGMMEFIREPGQTPQAAAPGMGDHSTAMAFFGAIMTGLYRRERTGEGAYVTTSLIANGVWANGMALQGVMSGADLGAVRQEKGWVNPFTGSYRTRDGHFVVFAIINPTREWPYLCEALGHPEWMEDPRFEAKVRMKNRHALTELMADSIAAMNLDELMETLDFHDITYSRVMRMADVIDDEHLKATGVILETADGGEDYQWTVNSPISVGDAPKKPPHRAPDVGAHSIEVLTELGKSAAEIAALIASGVVRSAD